MLVVGAGFKPALFFPIPESTIPKLPCHAYNWRILWYNHPMTHTISETAQLKIVHTIAKELSVGPPQVAAAVALLDEGSTVPFIARYRKEATDNLDDTQLRNLEERLLY